LDGRPVRSPSGNPLEIPSNKTLLALLVAGEWESQKVSLKAYSLPLVCLSYLWL
jgi:ATP synthase F1 complex assembly factor 2